MKSCNRSTYSQLGALVIGLCLAGPALASNSNSKSDGTAPPPIDHILLEVKDLKRSLEFYENYLGLHLKKKSGDFAMLESGNVGIYLWSNHWPWSPPAQKLPRPQSGMYPHFAVTDTKAFVSKLRQAGYRIVQEVKDYDYGTEAFVADPDGFIWALITEKK
jgi:catechol 2,3-dioxygenase-like lactoylglutathione lyase family enzyme